MSSRRKLLRLLSLVCGVLLIVASPFLIFHPEKIYYSFPSPAPGYYWGYNIYYVLSGAFLLAAGMVLIVASYYKHGETNLPMKI